MKSRNRDRFEKCGNVYFVTFTVVGFTPIFYSLELCEIIINNIKYYQDRGDFTAIAYVIMPNHVHLVVKVNDSVFISACIGNLKRITSRLISQWLRENGKTRLLNSLAICAQKEPAKDCRIWKPRFDCFVINNENTLRQKIEYIHNNPVKKELVTNAVDWNYSSALNYAGNKNCLLDIDVDWICLGYDKMPSGKGS